MCSVVKELADRYVSTSSENTGLVGYTVAILATIKHDGSSRGKWL